MRLVMPGDARFELGDALREAYRMRIRGLRN